MINPASLPPDVQLEADIATQLMYAMNVDLTLSERRVAWERVRELHAMRSPETVREMEAEQGLAR